MNEEPYGNADFILHAPVLRSMVHGFVIELGPNTGDSSTRAINYGLKDWYGHTETYQGEPLHVAVDYIDNLLVRPTDPWFHLVVGDSRDAATMEAVKEIAENRKANVIFIDTIHQYEFLKRELEVWLEMANSETVWLFHDTWMLGTYNYMTEAIIEFAEAHPEWEYVELSRECNGFGMLRPRG